MSVEALPGDTQVRPSACRRLFFDQEETNNGSIDNFANEFKEEIHKDQEKAKLKWNFDFVNETPLEGRWEWKKVDEEEATQPVEASLVPAGVDKAVERNNRINATEQTPLPEQGLEASVTLH